MPSDGKTKSAFTDARLGDHFCSIYANVDQQFSAVAEFFRAGLRNNHKCIYITEEHPVDGVFSELRKRGVNVETYREKGQLTVLTKEQSYLKDGSFDPEGRSHS